jgi:hypothetical protein
LKRLHVAVWVFVLLAAGFAGFSSFATSDLGDSNFPLFSMPVEHVNYTIVNVNGVLWAQIDGNYPIHILNYNPDFSQLPIVYPTPPQTTNITIKLNGNTVDWGRYAGSDLHHTAIGDWQMVSCVLENVSEFFTLTIHYQHPVQFINGSFLFLYDLNISPYLSEQSNNSTCYYTIKFQDNASNIQAYTTQTDTNWNPINLNITKQDNTTNVSIIEHSELGKPLPGDLIVEFSDSNAIVISEFPTWILPALAIPVTLTIIIYAKRKQLPNKNKL